jgi:hypothetical protein
VASAREKASVKWNIVFSSFGSLSYRRSNSAHKMWYSGSNKDLTCKTESLKMSAELRNSWPDGPTRPRWKRRGFCFVVEESMPIAEGIAAAKGALDVSKLVLDLLRRPNVDGQAVRDKLLELQDLIFSAQRALGDAEEENRQLRRQLDDRVALKALEEDLEFCSDGAFLRRKSEVAKRLDNPYCPACWGEKRLAVPLAPMEVTGYYRCPLHDVSYKTEAGRKKVSWQA